METRKLRKVLLATDGSERAAVASELVRSVRWPETAVLEVLRVNEPFATDVELPPEALVALDRDVRLDIDARLGEERERLAKRFSDVATAMRRGRPATEIALEAERVGADLIVMGSRGQGPIATMLLGSVAIEVVDRADRPVLVCRAPRLRRLVVADDGTAEAALAVKLVASWPIFGGVPTRAVSVAPVHAITGRGPIRHADAKKDLAEGVDALRGLHGFIADDAAIRLTDAGVPARSEVRFGDPATEIISAALEHDADAIVVGSHGRSGLERLVMGSVARKVLTHAPMSVLVVRGEREG